MHARLRVWTIKKAAIALKRLTSGPCLQHGIVVQATPPPPSLCLGVWLCLKMGSENMVLVRLLQIGAKDLTVLYHPHFPALLLVFLILALCDCREFLNNLISTFPSFQILFDNIFYMIYHVLTDFEKTIFL